MKKITKLKIAKIFLDVPRKQFYFGFQYINESSVKFVQNISKLISKILHISSVFCISKGYIGETKKL